jgi:hypothetical protein
MVKMETSSGERARHAGLAIGELVHVERLDCAGLPASFTWRGKCHSVRRLRLVKSRQPGRMEGDEFRLETMQGMSCSLRRSRLPGQGCLARLWRQATGGGRS